MGTQYPERAATMADNWAAEINGDEDDDEALRIAIAMSLGQDPGEKRERPRVGGVIDLTKEDDDGSTTESGDDDGDDGEVQVIDGSGVRETSSHTNRAKPAPLKPAPASSLSALGLDRKKMEEERLARLRKRKAAQLEDAQPPSRPAQRPRTDEIPTKKERAVAAKPKAVFLAPASAPTPASTSPRLPFPQGVVKKTWAYGQPRQGDDIKIEEVLQKQQLELAVLSSYQWDEEWLLRRIDLARTKLILIAFATDEAQVSEKAAVYVTVLGKESDADDSFHDEKRKRRCVPTCRATGSASVSRRCSPWARCTRSFSSSNMRTT